MIKIAKKGKMKFKTSTGLGLSKAKGFYQIKSRKGQAPSIKRKGQSTTVKYKKKKPTVKKKPVKKTPVKKKKPIVKKKHAKKKKPKPKKKYLVDLKREKRMAGIGWKVARTTRYLDQPKKAIGKKGYPYAILNKNKHYESFYTWKEKPSKKKVVKTKTPKQKEKYKKKVEKRIRKGKDIGWGW